MKIGLIGALALGLCAGCAASQQSVPQLEPMASRSGTLPASLGFAAGSQFGAMGARHDTREQHYPKKGQLLFVTQEDSTPEIEVYTGVKDRKFEQVATITDSIYTPGQVALDSAGTLYVPSVLGAYLTEFPNGSTVPTSQISVGLTSPWGAVVDAKDTLYVSNQYPPSISEYPKGSNTPSVTITSSMFQTLLGEALDASGNLYVADDVNHQVYEVPAGSTIPQSLFLEGMDVCAAGGPYYPAGLGFDKHGKLYVSCPVGNAILVYKLPGVSPIKILSTGMNEPYFFDFTTSGILFVANFGGANVELLKPPSYTQSLGTLGGYASPVGAIVRP